MVVEFIIYVEFERPYLKDPKDNDYSISMRSTPNLYRFLFKDQVVKDLEIRLVKMIFVAGKR